MYVIIIFFNDPRTDFLVVGPFRSQAQAEAALPIERARRSNAEVNSMEVHPMMASPQTVAWQGA